MKDKPIDWQARRDGFKRNPTKSPDSPINWKFWGGLKDIKQWEACALSLNVNPDTMQHHPQAWMAGPGSGPIFTDASFPSETAKAEFDRRLQMLNRIAKGNRAATVNPVEFAELCLHLEFTGVPPELVAMATRTRPAPAQDAATPVPVVGAASGAIHSTKERRDSMTPVIELAQKQCRNPKDDAEVWAVLLMLAEKKTPPLIGATEDGLQYLKGGNAANLNRAALKKRLNR